MTKEITLRKFLLQIQMILKQGWAIIFVRGPLLAGRI